jgi:hypothetical protein
VPEGTGEEVRDAGDGTGICMHNLFAFAPTEPSWLLYVSLASFRETAYQAELGRTFSSFDIGRRIAQSTGMDPMKEVEAMLVTAEDIFDWRTFRVVASYDSGEEKLATGLKKSQGSHPDFKWVETEQGYEAAMPGDFRWHLVGSGRVLAVTHEPKRAQGGGATNPKALPENPFAAKDAGVKAPDAGVKVKKPSLPRGSFPDWPRQVECLVEKTDDTDDEEKRKEERPAKSDGQKAKRSTPENKKISKNSDNKSDLIQKSESFLTPDAEGHWPVALLLTQDPRAVGLGLREGRALGFDYALVRGYFTEPVRVEGTLQFKGNPKRVAALATAWRSMAKQAAGDPFLALAGVSHLLRDIQISSEGQQITFRIEMKQNQVISTLLFLQLQGKVLEGYLKSD